MRRETSVPPVHLARREERPSQAGFLAPGSSCPRRLPRPEGPVACGAATLRSQLRGQLRPRSTLAGKPLRIPVYRPRIRTTCNAAPPLARAFGSGKGSWKTGGEARVIGCKAKPSLEFSDGALYRWDFAAAGDASQGRNSPSPSRTRKPATSPRTCMLSLRLRRRARMRWPGRSSNSPGVSCRAA